MLWCMTLTSGPLTNFGLLFPGVCFVFVWPSFIGAVMSMIKGGYAIPAAEQELGRPFTVGHDRGWSATVRHVRPWSATQVGHAGRPWSVTISHEHDSRKHATFPIFYGRDPERTSCTQNDQVWEGSLSTTKPDVLNPTRCRVMFEYVYVALKYPEINCVVTVRRLFYSRETIGREVW